METTAKYKEEGGRSNEERFITRVVTECLKASYSLENYTISSCGDNEVRLVENNPSYCDIRIPKKLIKLADALDLIIRPIFANGTFAIIVAKYE